MEIPAIVRLALVAGSLGLAVILYAVALSTEISAISSVDLA